MKQNKFCKHLFKHNIYIRNVNESQTNKYIQYNIHVFKALWSTFNMLAEDREDFLDGTLP